ncbi:MAG TPA: transglutaminase-like domain-containing protein [Allosphingosinicella sp.]|nr:transglutaminase-like domain-containing protein [Allosphingosinicella sp.]
MLEEIVHLGLVDDEEIALDAAALELAALDHPRVSLTPYLKALDDFTERVSRQPQGAAPGARAGALAAVLFEEEGFRGDRETYDDPANADLIEVMNRRRGLPVSLSILYVAVARRLGWAADALNTPGHVLVRLGPEHAPLIVDPFNGGATVGAQQLASLLGDAPEVALQHLAPMSNRLVLVRLLMNQATRAERAGRPQRALSLYQRITTVAPEHGHGWWERARIELVLREVEPARASLAAMLEVTRDPQMRLHVGAALDALGGVSR